MAIRHIYENTYNNDESTYNNDESTYKKDENDENKKDENDERIYIKILRNRIKF